MSAALLTISRDGETIRELPIEGEAVLGRAEECEVRLDDRAVSRKHAVLRLVDNGLQVEKKSEFAPLSVNGSECTSAVLRSGDQLAVGPFLLSVSWPNERTARKEPDSWALPASAVAEQPTVALSAEAAPADLPEQPQGALGDSIGASVVASGEFSGFETESAPGPDAGVGLAVETQSQPASSGLNVAAPEAPAAAADPSGNGLNFNMDTSSGPSASATPAFSDGGDIRLSPPDSGPPDAAQTSEAQVFADSAETPSGEVLEASEPYSEDGATRVASTSSLQAKLVLGPGAANVTEYEIRDQEVILGRGKECQILLADKKASRKHTMIRRSGAAVLIRDLGSANGTYVNGVRIKEQQLSGEDVIRIGDTEIRFQALSADYERKKDDFAQIPDEPTNATSSFMPPDLGFGDSPEQQPFAQSLPQSLPQSSYDAQKPAAGPIPGQIPGPIPGMFPGATAGGPAAQTPWERWKALPPRKRLIYGLVVILLISTLWEDEEPAKQKPKAKPSASQVQGVGAKQEKTFENLTPDQKKFVESQHALAFELYRNKEYDKALFEIRKIFQLVPDYKDAREIERYAQEGQRKVEAMEEERKRKEEEARVKEKVTELVQEAQRLMEAKSFAQAGQLFPQILALDPENPIVSQWQRKIASIEEEKLAAAERERVRREIDNGAMEIIESGEALKSQGKCIEAMKEFEKVPQTGTMNKKILARAVSASEGCKEAIAQAVRPVLDEANQAEQGGDVPGAYKLYLKVLGLDPGNAQALSSIERIRGTLHERAKLAYTEAIVAESYSDYDTAMKKYRQCMEIAPKDDIYFERAERRLSRFYPLDPKLQGE